MDRQELVDGFDLDDQRAFDQQINHVPSCDLYSFVFDGQRDLALICDPPKLQLAAEAGVIGGLQKARAQMTVYFDCCADDLFTGWVGAMLNQSHGPSPKPD